MSTELSSQKSETMERIMEIMGEFLNIDPMSRELDQFSLRSGRAFMVAQTYYIQESRFLENLLTKKTKLDLHLRRYYLGEATPQMYQQKPLQGGRVLKTDLDMWVKADDLWLELSAVIEEQKRKIKFIESCFDRIRQMGYEVKNAIEWRKYMDGA